MDKNELIARLPRRDQRALLAAAETVRLVPGTLLFTPGHLSRHVYFPVDGFISLTAAIADESGLEVAMVGREGMVGVHVVLGVSVAPVRATVRGAGTAWRIASGRFRSEQDASKALQRLLARYLYVLMEQMANSACCNRFHHLQPRLAHHLLVSQDRMRSDNFHVTHQALANLLGVRREGITSAAGDLQGRGLLSYRRGEVTVLDRAGLEAAACACYAADRDVYRRMLES